MPGTDALSADLTTLVRSVSGVTTVYDAGSSIGRALGKVADLVSGRRGDTAPILVKDPSAGITVSVSIGVADAASAAEVCRRVHDAIAEHLAARGEAASEIAVQVSSIG